MTNNKKEAVESVRPFIRYFQGLSLLRKIGFSFFIKTCSMTPRTIKTVLGDKGGAYKSLFSDTIHIPSIFFQVLVLISCILFILSIANSATYLHSFFVFIILSLSLSFLLVVKMAEISKAGLGLQFRIPENFEKISQIINNNYRGMSISKSPSVRYATVAFKDVQGEDLNPFKLIAIINGIVEYFEISHTDFIGRSDQEDIIEQLLNDKKDPGVKNGQ